MDAMRAERGVIRDVAEIAGSLAFVSVLAGVGLRALDALPALLRGEGPGVVRVDSVEAAERLFGGPLVLPAFFPDTLAWPPSAIRVRTTPPVAVVLVFTGRDGRTARLWLCEVRGPAPPPDLLPAGRSLHRVTLEVPGAPGAAAVLERVQVADGSVSHDLVWRQDSGTIVLRYAGAADELVAIAHSLRRRRP